jgi:hypothetical protein
MPYPVKVVGIWRAMQKVPLVRCDLKAFTDELERSINGGFDTFCGQSDEW